MSVSQINSSDDILIELKKIVQGNAANFEQLRAIRILLEKNTADGGHDCHLPPREETTVPESVEWCEKCQEWRDPLLHPCFNAR